MAAFNCIITVHLLLADDFESKFQFHPVEDLPPPDEFKPFPRIYPSKENRGSSTAQYTRYFSSLPLTSISSIELLFSPSFLALTVNPKPPGMRTHLR